MKKFKTLLFLGLATVALSSFSHAKKPEEQFQPAHSPEQGYSKQKELPKGLEKKLERNQELPPGWQKKLIVGKPFDAYLMQRAIISTNPKYYNKEMNNTRETIYQIENKIIKVMTATNIILDVFDDQ